MARRFVEAWNAGVVGRLLATRFGLSLPACWAVVRELRKRGELMSRRRHVRLGVLLGLLVTLTGPAWGHPGRLDATGCHTVRKPGGFTYKSGKVAPEGQVHCHRALVGKPIVLDGLEVLGERGDEARDEDDEEPRRREAR